jgi:hypothetical protein
MLRVIPNIPQIRARWAHRASEIPDWLEVPMSDGRTIQYYPKVPQPAFTETIRIIRNMTDPQTGYKRKEPASAATLDRAQIK